MPFSSFSVVDSKQVNVSRVEFSDNLWVSEELIQPAFTCSKLTIDTLEQDVKYVQS